MTFGLGIDVGGGWPVAAVARGGRVSLLDVRRPVGVGRYGDASVHQLLAATSEAVATEDGVPAVTVVTHRVGAGDDEVAALREAAALACLGRRVLLPVALAVAAHHAARERVDDGEVLAVCDLAERGFELSLVRRRHDGFALLGSAAAAGIDVVGLEEALEQAAEGSGLRASDVGRLLLVGGCARTPLLARVLREVTGRPVVVGGQPEVAAACGAALLAAGMPPTGVATCA